MSTYYLKLVGTANGVVQTSSFRVFVTNICLTSSSLTILKYTSSPNPYIYYMGNTTSTDIAHWSVSPTYCGPFTDYSFMFDNGTVIPSGLMSA